MFKSEDNVVNLRDYRVIRDQALEEGMNLGEYLSLAKRLGISRKELIKGSYEHLGIEGILLHRKKGKKVRRILTTAAMPFLVYLTNFGAMNLKAEIGLPNNYHSQQLKYVKNQEIIADIDKRGYWPVGALEMQAKEFLGEKEYTSYLKFKDTIDNYKKTKSRATNPLRHFRP